MSHDEFNPKSMDAIVSELRGENRLLREMFEQLNVKVNWLIGITVGSVGGHGAIHFSDKISHTLAAVMHVAVSIFPHWV